MNKENNRENRVNTMKNVIQLIGGGEMTKEKFEKMKNTPVAPGCTVGQLVGSSLELGSLVWEEGRVVIASKHEIGLDYQNEIRLKNKAMRAGLTPRELIITFIEEKLEE